MNIETCWQLNTIDPSGAKVATIQAIECVLAQFLQIAIRFAGIVVFIMLIAGGFKYLTAGGDQKAIESAEGTITYAILGLVLMIVSWFILLFIKEFTNIGDIQFIIPR